MEARLIVTVGVSGSGKSTYSHLQFLKDPLNTIIVNRDKIRELLFGFTEDGIKHYYENPNLGKFEKEVTRYEDTLINDGLNAGKLVIVDATHLKRSYLERFKYWNVPTELKIFTLSLENCLENDLKRTRSVGEDIINKQYNRFKSLLNNLTKKPIDFTPTHIDKDPLKEDCFIFDIDGTLAHMVDRSPYDWKSVGQDKIDLAVTMVANMVQKSDVKLIVCTGRDSVCRPETEMWLEKISFLDYDLLMHRKNKDQRADWIVKQEMWEDISKKHNIIGMFDDRLQVVRRARALGFKVFNVEYNNF